MTAETETPQAQPAATDQGVVIGIDLGGTKALAGVVAADGQVIGRSKLSTRRHGEAAALLTDVAGCARHAAEQAGVPFSQVRAVGIGVPGPVDVAAGVVRTTPNLGWENVPVRDLLSKDLGVPVAVDNDVRVATIAEHQLGAGKGLSRVVTFFVGTGLGGGLVFDDLIYRGAHSSAGEIGHTFVKAGGPRCAAGHPGCLEAMASRTAITRDLAAAVKQGHTTVLTKMVGKDLTVARSGDLLEALNKHDKLTEKVIKRAAKYLGYGIASAVNLLDPDIIILGGGVVEALGNLLIDHAVKIARPNILADVARATPIVRATLGDDAGMLGAALIAKALLTESPGNES